MSGHEHDEDAVRAMVMAGPGRRPRMARLRLQPPQAREVEVEIAAAGVCGSDLHVVNGEWDVPTPVVLGHEGAGVVTRVGSAVTTLEVGDHVVLSWVPQCGRCSQCLRGKPWQCEVVAERIAPLGVLYDGTTRWRTEAGDCLHHYLGVSSFAERVVVPESGAVRIRRDAPLDAIAIIGCAVATGVGAVRNTARVEEGASVAVIGCGGVGLSCVQGARLAGAAEIVAVDVNPAKLATARRLGATAALEVGSGDAVAQLRGLVPGGCDYAFDAIGRTSTTEQAIQSLGQGGTAVIVGLPPAGERARFDALALAEAGQSILGCNYGSVDPQRDLPMLVDLFMSGDLDLESMIYGRRPLAEAAEALDDLASGAALRTLLVADAD